MIIREEKNNFIMIEQHHHASISGELFTYLHPDYFRGDHLKQATQYAITNHDCGWIPFDKTPFLNDEKNQPFSFIDLPIAPKVLLYTYGINIVEKHDSYAALLCSEHYTRFLLKNSAQEAKDFLISEQERKKRLISRLKVFDEKLFAFHYGLVQLFDNLSLFICLTTKDVEHPYFQHGIPLSSELTVFKEQVLKANWLDDQTISINEFPFRGKITLHLKQKSVAKEKIETLGLIKAYEAAAYDTVSIRLVP